MRSPLSPAALAFLDRSGWGMAHATSVAADFSSRQFFRLHDDAETAILMQDDAAAPSLAAYLKIDTLLRQAQLSAPMILAADAAAGFAIVEDFGDENVGKLLDAGADPQPLYETAIDVLIALHRRFDPAMAVDLRRYDANAFVDIVRLFADETLPAITGAPLATDAIADFAARWQGVLQPFCAGRETLLLRDYHAGNLMHLAEREGVRRLGLLDFQDAGLGPSLYDVVSLLLDSRRPLSAALRDLLFARYAAAFPELKPADLAAARAVWTAQRLMRVIAIYDRTRRRQDRAEVRHFLPQAVADMSAALAHPALARMADWMTEHLPPEKLLIWARQVAT